MTKDNDKVSTRPVRPRDLVAYHPRAANYSTRPANIFARGPRVLGSARRFDHQADHVAAGGAEAGHDELDSVSIAFDGEKVVKLDEG